MDIQKLIAEIIPPSDYQHRNGFSNNHLIDRLTEYEKNQVEDALINKLLTNNEDTLIVETLAYMKSQNSLPVLYSLLEKSFNNIFDKLVIAASIFEINKDGRMIDVGIDAFKQVTNKYLTKSPYFKYQISTAFYYLKKFNKPETDNIIKAYIEYPENLVSYNAKRYLGL